MLSHRRNKTPVSVTIPFYHMDFRLSTCCGNRNQYDPSPALHSCHAGSYHPGLSTRRIVCMLLLEPYSYRSCVLSCNTSLNVRLEKARPVQPLGRSPELGPGSCPGCCSLLYTGRSLWYRWLMRSTIRRSLRLYVLR